MYIAVVTGVSGFIGSHFTRRLLDLDWIVYGIDLNQENEVALEFSEHKNFSWIGRDICTISKLPDCDYVFNFAAETHVANSIENSKEFIRTNVDGVRNLLDLVRKKPNNVVKKPLFFHVSTDEVYGDGETPHKETDLLNPSNPYSASKAAGDMLIQSYFRTYGLEYIIVRPTNNYGTHQHPEKLIPLTIKLAKWNQEIRLHNHGTPKRTWLNVGDTVDAILCLVHSDVRGIFNISGNLEQTNLTTVTKILWTMNIKNVQDYINLNYERPGQDMKYLVDDSKLKSLNWKCRRNFDDEISNIVKFYMENSNSRLFEGK